MSWLGLFLLELIAFAAPTPRPPAHLKMTDVILQCAARAENFSGRLFLDETGRAALVASHAKATITCPLRIEDFKNLPEAVVPEMSFVFPVGECQDASGKGIKDPSLADRVALKVLLPASGKPKQAKLFWINHLQPMPCVLEKFESESLKRNATRFKKGLFGSR